MRVTEEDLVFDLKKLGIEKGDILFITIDIMKVGYFCESRDLTLKTWLRILTDLVGEDGAIVFASYSKTFFRFFKKKYVFERFSDTYAGSLPNYLINLDTSIRSLHPTNSVVGIGDIIKKALLNHDSTKLSYSVLGDLINMPNSKFLMIGTIDKMNAPGAMHFVQEELGYTKYSPMKYLMQIYFYENGVRKLFTKKDFGGCSSGGYRLFFPLITNSAVKFGQVGRAVSALIPAKKSYNIIKSELIKNRKIIQCDDKTCIHCYGNPIYNGFGSIIYYFKNAFLFPKIIYLRIKKYFSEK
jgi:aminoglycoside 3-N-acetyltransferase